MSILLALLSSVGWGAADFLGGTMSKTRRATIVVATSQAFGLLSITVVAAVLGAFGDDPAYLPWALLSGLAGMVGLVSFYAALASGTMGVVSPIAALGVVVPVLVGLATGERPTVLQLVGITIAICGVVLASGPELSGRAGARPLLLAAVAAVGFGVALLAIAKGSATSPLMTLVAMRCVSVVVLGAALGLAVLRGRMPAAELRLDRRSLGLLAAVGVGDVAANLTFGIASTKGLVSIVAVLGSLYPVMTVLLARFVHSKRLGRAQTAGVAGALVGVVLIAA